MRAPQSSAPAWVRKRDGRLVPFDADKICRSLFAASESCGRPDAFLARELADAAVHFLADESSGSTPAAEQVQEVVAKVLREMRQYALAAAFEERARTRHGGAAGEEPAAGDVVLRFAPATAPSEVRDACLRSFALQAVFTRDLMAAHHDGLIVLEGLETPERLHAVTAGPLQRPEELLDCLGEAAAQAGQTLVLDGVEHILARSLAGQKRVSRLRAEETARSFAEVLLRGLRLTGLQAVVNLNAAPPAWAEESAGGPLFAEQQPESGTSRTALLADALAETIQENGGEQVRINWHLSEADFAADAAARLTAMARAALAGTALALVFGRPRRPVVLAEGITRNHPAVLLAVGLNLPRLAGMVAEEVADPAQRPGRFRGKLRSLARLALSAALRKREYLRRQAAERPSLSSGFLLERARLLAVPLGLDDAVLALAGQRLCAGEEALALGCGVLELLRDTLRDEGRASALETCLDALPRRESAGPTCWDPDILPKSQLRVLGALQTAAGGGTGTLFVPHDPPATAEQAAGWLRWAWSQTSILRLVLRRSGPALRQMTFEAEPTS